MIPTIVIASITVIVIILSVIFFPHIKIGRKSIDTYWMIALLGAFILLVTQLAPISKVYDSLISNSKINPIKILILFFSMTMISIYLDELGMFRYLAGLATRRAKGNQYLLFFILYGLTAALTIVTSNDIVILTFTPFICFFCKNAKINPVPYLVAEFVAANTWSLMLIIGNPTNIYLATSAGVDFGGYIKVMWLPTLLCGITELLILFIIFRKKLKEPLDVTVDNYSIVSKPDLYIGIFHLVICLSLLIVSSYIHIEMWLVSLICAVSLFTVSTILRILTHRHWEYITNPLIRLPYQLIPFFLSMFVIVVALNEQGVSSQIASILGDQHVIYVYGYTSFLTCNVINNIPMSILYSSLSVNLPSELYLPAIFASIIGSNIGAFLTPLGALAGIMFSSLINKYEVKFSFVDFMKYGVIIAIPTITIALLSLNLSFLIF